MALRVEVRSREDATEVVEFVGKLRREFGNDNVTQARGYTGGDGFMVSVTADTVAEAGKVRTVATWWVELKEGYRNDRPMRGASIWVRRRGGSDAFAFVYPWPKGG